MGKDIRRLIKLVYPTAPRDVREILAIEQFLDGLHDSEMRLEIKQGRPINLNDAIQRAIELEAFFRAEKRHTEGIVRSDRASAIGSDNTARNVKYKRTDALSLWHQQ